MFFVDAPLVDFIGGGGWGGSGDLSESVKVEKFVTKTFFFRYY